MKTRIPSLLKYNKPLIIPKSIDFDKILKDYPPMEKGVERDCLVYLVSLIYTKSFYSTKVTSEKRVGFVNLKMVYLRNKFHAAKKNLHYLIKLNIVECQLSYIPNVASRRYRLNSDYLNGETQQVFFRRRINYTRISRTYDSSEAEIVVPEFLARPFQNNSISLDFDLANRVLDSIYSEKIRIVQDDNSIEEYDKNEEVEDLLFALKIQKETIARICNNDFEGSYFIDSTSFRFHSLITTLKKEVRPLIKLDGFETVGLDLKNSQPFFLLLLMKKAFYLERNRERKILRMNNIDIISQYKEYIIHNINPLMIGKSSKNIENIDSSVYEFCQAIREGRLYELLLSKIWDINAMSEHHYLEMRSKIKEQFLIFLYDTPERQFGKKSVTAIMKNNYPQIFEFIMALKSFKVGETTYVRHSYLKCKNGSKLPLEVDAGFKMLSKLIQSIESKVLLERVCSKINCSFPDLSFLTVHDSIIIPESYKDKVLNILISEIERLTWETPQIKVEY